MEKLLAAVMMNMQLVGTGLQQRPCQGRCRKHLRARFSGALETHTLCLCGSGWRRTHFRARVLAGPWTWKHTR